MKAQSPLSRPGIKSFFYRQMHASSARLAMLILFLTAMSWSAFAQTVAWTDSFVHGQAPTFEQCKTWTDFLDQLGNKSFSSVKITGSLDEVGLSITDPVAATKLAELLSSRTPGVVEFGSKKWIVSFCGNSVCGLPSVALSIDENVQEDCSCNYRYAIKAHSTGLQWGGVNSVTCNGPDQRMKLEFNSGVSIDVSGPTSFCSGGSVVLTANTQICIPPYNYLWSNGATTESITVHEAGSYSVTVSGSDQCSGTSAATAVSVIGIDVNAGEDVTFCKDPVQLQATTISGNGSGFALSKHCIFDAAGGDGNCNFVKDLCTEGAEFFTDATFTTSVVISNPAELRFQLYYSPFADVSSFIFTLNGQEIGSYEDNDPTGTCDPVPFGQYPRTITFTSGQFKKHWNDSSENTLAVRVLSDGPGVYLGGITAEVVSSSEFYSWAPTTGLNDASIANPLASPEVSTTYTVTYTNANGCSATDQVYVKVVADCAAPAPVAACKSLIVSAGTNCEAIVNANQFDDGSFSSSGGTLTFTTSHVGPYPIGVTEIIFTVTDSIGGSSNCNATLTVVDTTLPTITAPVDLVVVNDPGTCTATLSLAPPETSDNCGVQPVVNDHSGNVFPAGDTWVTWTVTDIHGNQQTALQKITVTNTDPVIDSVTASASTVEINSPVDFTIGYTDNNIKNATINWGDQSAPELLSSAEDHFVATHSYSNAGTYPVRITLTDHCGASTDYVYESIVVLNKYVGSVKGSGWFDSKSGYYLQDRKATGKADFKFEAKYKSKESVPSGSTSFHFKAGKLEFNSTRYELLVVDGQKAFLTGEGKLNGKAGYGILISLVDGDLKTKDHHQNDFYAGRDKGNTDKDHDKDKKDKDKHDRDDDKDHKKSDRIRVKIWDAKGVVYDTQLGSPDNAGATTYLGGGSIKIQSDEKTFGDSFENTIPSYSEEGSITVYPNPFVDRIKVQFSSWEPRGKVIVQLMDLTGKVIYKAEYPVSDDGSYTLDIPQHKKDAGIYILKISQGIKSELIRLVRK